MGLHYYHGGADPEELQTLAENSSIDFELPDDIEELADVARENGYVIKAVMLEDKPE